MGTVTGTIFNDINGNGKKDSGDGGIAGRIVFIDENKNSKIDPGEPTAVTNSSGVYTLTNVPAGSTRVTEFPGQLNVPDGFRIDSPASGFFDVTLKPGQTFSKLDFANTQLALISGTVFLDSNGNKKRDASETGLVNRTVYLDLNNDGVRESTEPTTLTDATGAFAFTTVKPGTYVVRLQPDFGFTLTTPAAGATSVTVGQGETHGGLLFGEKPVTLNFAGPAKLATTGAKPVALVVADFNNDKLPDIATADSAGNDVTVFLNKGNGSFGAGKKFAVGKDPVGIVAGDFNGDGKTDLAVADQVDNAIDILVGDGKGTFMLAPTALSAAAPNGIAAFDFNGDKTDRHRRLRPQHQADHALPQQERRRFRGGQDDRRRVAAQRHHRRRRQPRQAARPAGFQRWRKRHDQSRQHHCPARQRQGRLHSQRQLPHTHQPHVANRWRL